MNQQNVVLDQARQRETLLLPQVESLAGRLRGMETMLSEMGVVMNEYQSG